MAEVRSLVAVLTALLAIYAIMFGFRRTGVRMLWRVVASLIAGTLAVSLLESLLR